MTKRSHQPPQWSPEDEQFEALRDLLRCAPEPPAPPPEHVAHLNRAVMQRLEERRRAFSPLRRLAEAALGLWYAPLARRVAFAGSLASMLLVGVWYGMHREAMLAPTAPVRLAVLPPGAITGAESESLGAGSAIRIADAGALDALRGATRGQDSDLFPSVVVIPSESSEWVSLGDGSLDQEGVFETVAARPLRSGGYALDTPLNLDGLMPERRGVEVGRAGSDPVQRLMDDDLLGEMRRLKLDLYLAGETDLIPQVQRMEEVLTGALVSTLGNIAREQGVDVETQRRFAEAENSLLRRDYRRAEEVFNDIAHEHGGTRLATLCWYHLGDISYDFHGDFAWARQTYERCLAGQAEEVFSPAIIERIRHRLEILEDAAAANYEPLQLLRQAEAAPAAAAVDLHRQLLLRYPTSGAVVDGINTLAERALREVPGEESLPFQAIDLLRQYQGIFAARHRTLAQLRLADIVYFRVRDLPQALIEYGQVQITPEDTAMEAMVRERIAQILDNRIAQREF